MTSPPPTFGSAQPNIMFILSDQQRWDTLGCYGQPLDITPNLDRMASEGVRFELAFTCQPVCGPARACLQTGKYATETGCTTNGIGLAPGEKTIAHWLSEAGYEVGYIGKWHLATSRWPIGGRTARVVRTEPVPPELRGGYKDYWLASDVLEHTSHSYDGHMFDATGARREFPPDRYRVDAHTDWVIEYLRARTSARPFFLFVSYIEPHFQNDHAHFEGPRGSQQRFRDFVPPGDLVGLDGDWREEYPDYLGCCQALDGAVGRIREELQRLGLSENTLLIYTSDHGCHFRTRNREYKRSCHDSSIRIPLIACGPSFCGGAAVKELVSLIDLPPTLLRAGGIEPPAYMRGRPLQELVGDAAARDSSGGQADWPPEVFVQISEDHCGRAVRTREWTYEVRAAEGFAAPHDAGSKVYVEDCLYDLKADPHQRTNLVAELALAQVRAELTVVLKRYMAQVGEEEPQIRPAERAGSGWFDRSR